jgi:anhydro-N-acetylmuramic acid kinase
MSREMTLEKGLDRPVAAIGLMSGTSLDGIDAALIATDGVSVESTGPSLTLEYDESVRDRLRSILGSRTRSPELDAAERDMTLAHAEAVRRLLDVAGLDASHVGVIGFHGQTVMHAPEEGQTWQIGDAALLARETGIDVVYDFRSADMANGGEGAPLVPVFHRALAQGLERPLAVLNIGGVANVTWIGEDDSLLAFDTGPGNALIDDWVMRKARLRSDFNGELAQSGQVADSVLAALVEHDYFKRMPPKSLDRNTFDISALRGMSLEDGAATLTAFTAAAVVLAEQFFPASVQRWLVCGGGRLNPAIMGQLARRLRQPVEPVEAMGWDGDSLEAEAFGYLAVRSLAGLPLSFPSTTGNACPITGGRVEKKYG